jgi:co-chaperonin GroES (HSP10)
MAIPKSEKLAREDAEQPSQPAFLTQETATPTGPVQIREVKCCNDFIAILQFQHDTTIAMPDESRYKNEGIVVGVGPGVGDGAGGRLKPQLDIGEVVMFGPRNIAATIESDSPPYAGYKVIMTSERNILCKLPKEITWEPFDA